MSSEPVAPLIGLLRAYGVRYVVLHGERGPCAASYGPAELTAAVGSLQGLDGVQTIRRVGDDVVVELAPGPISRRVSPVAPVVRSGQC